jgi:predicted MFS family arabinose efflux permease
VVSEVQPSERAAALGALTAFYDLFVAASSAAAGAVAGRWGFAAVFWMTLACMGCSVALVLITGIGKGRTPVAPEEEVLMQRAGGS